GRPIHERRLKERLPLKASVGTQWYPTVPCRLEPRSVVPPDHMDIFSIHVDRGKVVPKQKIAALSDVWWRCRVAHAHGLEAAPTIARRGRPHVKDAIGVISLPNERQVSFGRILHRPVAKIRTSRHLSRFY